MLKSSSPLPVNVTLFGSWTFADVIKIKGGHTGLGLTLKQKSGILKTKIKTQMVQGRQEETGVTVPQVKEHLSHQKQHRRIWRERLGGNLILPTRDAWLLDCEEIHLLF